MDGTLYAVSMPQFLRKYKLIFKTFLYKLIKTLHMLNLNVIDNGLACDYGVCRVLIQYHRFCKKIFSLKRVVLISVLYLVYNIY